MIDREHLIATISESRCHSISTIADRLRCSKTTAWEACQKLCTEGLAWRNSNGKYRAISTRASALKSLKNPLNDFSERQSSRSNALNGR